MLNKAVQIAINAHKGQFDKGNQPYILHLFRVMNRGTSENEKIGGVLHDLVEDTDWTFERLEQEGFDAKIIEALKCVTKTSDKEDYEVFIKRVLTNPLACRIKINDLLDNMDITRLDTITLKDMERLNKYLKAYKLIQDYLNNIES